MNEIPTIRLQLDGLRYQVVHALQSHNEEIETYVDDQIKKEIESFDFEGVSRMIANEQIKKIVGATVSELFGFEFREEVQKMVLEAMRNRINPPGEKGGE